MPLAPTERLTPHFTAYELGADRPEANGFVLANLYDTAQLLESVRAVLGVPLLVNTPDEPDRGLAPRPDNPTSDHPKGLAADFVPLGYRGGMLSVYEALRAAHDDGRLAGFDQIIFYPLTGHVHAGAGSRMRGEFRIATVEGYPFISADTIAALGKRFGFASPWSLLLILAAGFVLLILA